MQSEAQLTKAIGTAAATAVGTYLFKKGATSAIAATLIFGLASWYLIRKAAQGSNA